MDEEDFEVRGAIGKRDDGTLLPVLQVTWDGSVSILGTREAMDIALNLMQGAMQSQIDVKIVSVMLARGATREDCQQFLNEMRELG